jgi:hypothetical protein
MGDFMFADHLLCGLVGSGQRLRKLSFVSFEQAFGSLLPVGSLSPLDWERPNS